MFRFYLAMAASKERVDLWKAGCEVAMEVRSSLPPKRLPCKATTVESGFSKLMQEQGLQSFPFKSVTPGFGAALFHT